MKAAAKRVFALVYVGANLMACSDAATRQEATATLQQALEPDEASPIGQKWYELGGTDVVGNPTSDVEVTPGDLDGEYQQFEHGVIVYSVDFGAVFLTRAIFDKWVSLESETAPGGSSLLSYVGFPVRDYLQREGHDRGAFERGVIVVQSDSTAWLVEGDISIRYTELSDVLGLPVAAQADVADGRFQAFENGEIHFKEELGAFFVAGAVLQRWNDLGGPGGSLGFPIADVGEILSPTSGVLGSSGRFEQGSIYASDSAGAWELTGPLLDAYESRFGGPSGWLGFPIGAPGVSGAGDPFSDFQNGVLVQRGTDAEGNPVIYPFGQLVFHLQRVVALGEDCGTCGAQDLFYYLTVDTSDGVVMNHKRYPDEGQFGQGIDTWDANLDVHVVDAANSAFTVTAAVDVYDNDEFDEDHLGTPSATYSIDNLWGYLEAHDHQSGNGFAQFNIKTPLPYDATDFRGQSWWSFENFTTEELSRAQFAKAFVDVSNDEEAWRHPFNALWYLAFEGVADGGNCFGMSLESIYAQTGRSPYAQPIHQYFPDTQNGDELTTTNPGHGPLYNEINIKQGYQLGFNGVAWFLALLASGEQHDPRANYVVSAAADLLGEYSLISMTDDYLFGSAHAVRPYRWDPPGACTELAGQSGFGCAYIHIGDPNFPTGDSSVDDAIEVDLVNNEYKYRDYRGGEWSGGRMFFLPYRLFSHTQYTPFANPLELLDNAYLVVMGTDTKTVQVTDEAERTLFEPGLSGPPTRWDQIRRDAGARVPNLAPVVMTDQALPSTMPLQIYAGRGIGATQQYDLVLSPDVASGTVEATFESGKLSSHVEIPGTPGAADSLIAHDIGGVAKGISLRIAEGGGAKTVTWTVAGPEKNRWAKLNGLTLAAAQQITIRLENGGKELVFVNDGPTTEADLDVKDGPGAGVKDRGQVTIPGGESTLEFLLPVTTLTLSDEALGLNGWYIAPVTVTLSAQDFSSKGIKKIEYSRDLSVWSTYSAPFSYGDEGETVLHYRAEDNARHREVPQSSGFKIDTRKPDVTASTDQTQYTRIQSFLVHFSATDPVPGSGVAEVGAEIDGESVANGQDFDLLWVPLGVHTLEVTAVDVAGWQTTKSVSFEIIATLADLPALVAELRQRGEIDSDGTANSLLATINRAIAAVGRGNRSAAINELRAAQRDARAQSGGHISTRAANLLVGDIDYVIAHLP